MVGSLHGQQQDIFPHTIPSASFSPIDAVGNFSGNNQSSDKSLRSISPYTFMARTTSLFSNQILPNDSSIPIGESEPNSPYMSMSSPYMSATALLQKASEMGAKTSEDPTSPLLLKGFPNYFTSRNHIGISSGVLQTSTANSDRKKTAENNIIPYMNLPWAGSCIEANNTVPWIGLPPFSMRAENRSSNIADEDRMKQSAHESIFGVKGVGLTQDFLGLGGNGNVQMSDDTYNGDTSLSYSDEQQKSQEDIYSYHQ
uniref:Uncharacterized protein n=1 Tax=Avena sativa TaxID=4498 RepID=A0ACD5UXE7_AVESA